jgi:hypothetical protein
MFYVCRTILSKHYTLSYVKSPGGHFWYTGIGVSGTNDHTTLKVTYCRSLVIAHCNVQSISDWKPDCLIYITNHGHIPILSIHQEAWILSECTIDRCSHKHWYLTLSPRLSLLLHFWTANASLLLDRTIVISVLPHFIWPDLYPKVLTPPQLKAVMVTGTRLSLLLP